MEQLIDIPYSVLKEDERAYEVLLLRDLYDNTYANIAKEFKLSNARIIEIYNRIKVKQIRLYIRHLSVVNGQEDTRFFKKIYEVVFECYQGRRYTTAYFEKEYKEILEEYRGGEPGMPEQFIAMLPPLMEGVGNDVIDRVIQFREVRNKTYPAIGKELQMTAEKAERIYQWHYHEKVVALLRDIKEKTGADLWEHYFNISYKAKKRYELLRRDYPEFFNEMKQEKN